MSDQLHRVSMSLVYWQDVRSSVNSVNQELAALIDDISPSKHFPLIKGHYRYGEAITNNGMVLVPEGDDVDVANEAAALLEQGVLCLQLNNESEKFHQMDGRTVPLDMFSAGEMFGFGSALQPLTGLPIGQPTTQITAGARSVFMLPKVTDARSHKRLNVKFGFNEPAPANLSEHWAIFKQIDSGMPQDNPWLSTVLFFPSIWFQPSKDGSWLAFHNYLLKMAWRSSYTSAPRWDKTLLWEKFCQVIRAKNLKPGPYMMDTVKHLFSIALGSAPGYKIVADKQDALPSVLLEQAYMDVYLLKDYAPIMMRPYRLGRNRENVPVYYSLGYPTLIEGSPTIRKAPSIITELRELKKLISIFQSVLSEEVDSMGGIIPSQLQYEYYHSGDDPFGEIRNSLDIEEMDGIISSCLNHRYPGREFSAYGPFLRGCVGVTYRDICVE